MARTARTNENEIPVEQAEVKVSLPEAEIPRVLSAFRLRMTEAVAREVYFFDTRGFELASAGLILRARKTSNLPDDVTVKLRPMKRGDLDAKWLRMEGLKGEVDIVGARVVESCSLTSRSPRGAIELSVIGAAPIDALLHKEQHGFVMKYAKVRPDWSAVESFGPILARIWKVPVKGLREGVTIELWRLPNNRRLLEASTKGPLTDSNEIQARLDKFLEGKGFAGVTEGDTKTRTAVQYFIGGKAEEARQ